MNGDGVVAGGGPEMMSDSGPGDQINAFCADLRELVRTSRFGSLRALARHLHYSHETVGRATRGGRLPSRMLVQAIVAACDGDVGAWTRRWDALYPVTRSRGPAPAWEPQALADGADPEDTAAFLDATTVRSRKVSLTARRQLVGEVELRYSPRAHAAWGRFKGYDGLTDMAKLRQRVELIVGVARSGADDISREYRTEYGYDWVWGDLVRTGAGLFDAWVRILFDDRVVAEGRTDRTSLA
jgi:hypothetical protein